MKRMQRRLLLLCAVSLHSKQKLYFGWLKSEPIDCWR